MSEGFVQVIKAPEAAEIVGCSRWTLYELVRQKKIPHWKIGVKGVRFDRVKILEWVKNGGFNAQETDLQFL